MKWKRRKIWNANLAATNAGWRRKAASTGTAKHKPQTAMAALGARFRLATRHLPLATAFAALLLMFAMLWASCGGGGAPAVHTPTGGTPAGTYTLTVTATSGSLSQSSTVTLTVQ